MTMTKIDAAQLPQQAERSMRKPTGAVSARRRHAGARGREAIRPDFRWRLVVPLGMKPGNPSKGHWAITTRCFSANGPTTSSAYWPYNQDNPIGRIPSASINRLTHSGTVDGRTAKAVRETGGAVAELKRSEAATCSSGQQHGFMCRCSPWGSSTG